MEHIHTLVHYIVILQSFATNQNYYENRHIETNTKEKHSKSNNKYTVS